MYNIPMAKKIITIPNPILRQKTKPIAQVDAKVLGIVNNLKKSLLAQKEPQGVGIAAPQIGLSERICLVYSRESRKFLTLISPEIVWRSKRMLPCLPNKDNPYEGCLSAPGLWGMVIRHKTIKVRYLSPQGQVVTRRFSGFTGIICQHEIDHLDGILFVDRILQQKGKLYEMKKNKEGKEELVEVNLS